MYLDLLLKRLRNLGPLDFLSRCDHATLGRPLVWRQDDILEELSRLEPVLLPESIALLQDKGLHFRVLAQIREATRCINRLGSVARALEGVTQVGLVRDDDGEGLLRVLAGVHADVADQVARLVCGLQALKRDILERP